MSLGRAAQSIVPKAPIRAITGEQVDVLPCETRDPLAYLCAAETLGAGGSAVQVRPDSDKWFKREPVRNRQGEAKLY